MAWRRRRQAMAKWRLDEESGADLDRGRTRTWGARTQRHFLRPQRHLAMAWRRRRQAMGTPSKFPKTWGGVGTRRPPTRIIILIILGLFEACKYSLVIHHNPD